MSSFMLFFFTCIASAFSEALAKCRAPLSFFFSYLGINGSMDEGHRTLFDVQTLTVVVRQRESLNDLLQDLLLYQTKHHLVQVMSTDVLLWNLTIRNARGVCRKGKVELSIFSQKRLLLKLINYFHFVYIMYVFRKTICSKLSSLYWIYRDVVSLTGGAQVPSFSVIAVVWRWSCYSSQT